jgi:hypothetical protein
MAAVSDYSALSIPNRPWVKPVVMSPLVLVPVPVPRLDHRGRDGTGPDKARSTPARCRPYLVRSCSAGQGCQKPFAIFERLLAALRVLSFYCIRAVRVPYSIISRVTDAKYLCQPCFPPTTNASAHLASMHGFYLGEKARTLDICWS